MIAFIDEYRDRFTARVHLYDVKPAPSGTVLSPPVATATLNVARRAPGVSGTVSWWPRFIRSTPQSMACMGLGKYGTHSPAVAYKLAVRLMRVFSRTIVGWALYDSMCTEALPLQALNQAIVSAKETTRSGGDFDDNALAKTVNGSYKNELVNNLSAAVEFGAFSAVEK